MNEVDRVMIVEVGPRDGLQNERRTLAPTTRAELVERCAAAGVPCIEAVSFAHPGRVPQMAGAEDVVTAVRREPGVRYAGLVLNERGYDRLAATALEQVHVVVVASETLSFRNQGVTTEASAAAAARIVERAHADGRRASVTVAAAFGCPFEGTVDPGRVAGLSAQAAAAGADSLVLADTIGVGAPREVRALVAAVLPLGVPVGCHFHNTRNAGYANALAALEAGATSLDAAVGGLGGCPFAPGAAGNVATEDLVWLLEREGVATGVDLDRLIETARWLGEQLGKELPGQLHRVPRFDAAVAGAAA